jgi:hypothetical protein
LVVAAAIRSAVFSLRPAFFSLALMCSYWRVRFLLVTPRGGIRHLRGRFPPPVQGARQERRPMTEW